MNRMTFIFILGVISVLYTQISTAQPVDRPPTEYEFSLVLVDLSGSMGMSDSSGVRKLNTAIDAVKAKLAAHRTNRILAVYTFDSGRGYKEIIGFGDARSENIVEVNKALDDILEIDLQNYSTPYAEAYCESVDMLINEMNDLDFLPSEVDLKIHVVTDGLENATPNTHECWGRNGAVINSSAPWTVSNSWEKRVVNKGFTGDPEISPPAGVPATIITNVIAMFDDFVVSAVETEAVHFFNYQTYQSGGYMHVVRGVDSVPVTGDINGDFCVDDTDYYILMDHYNEQGTAFIPGDLNGDRQVNYDDKVILGQNFGSGHSCNPV